MHAHTLRLAVPLLLLAACAGQDRDDTAAHDHDHDHDHDSADPDGAQSLRFAASLGGAPFACGASAPIGAETFTARDLRFYVTALEVLAADGTATPLPLAGTSAWQDAAVGLLDFEDGCAGGSPATNHTLQVDGPPGPWAGLRFVVGVPFADNHGDPLDARAPLDASGMFWTWTTGYKFLKLDGASDSLPGGLAFHLGSTGCTPDDSGRIASCAAPNRPTITLQAPFDPDTNEIVLDVDALLAGADLSTNTDGTASICMSAPNDPDCAPIFAHLGLGFGEAAPGPQTAFAVR